MRKTVALDFHGTLTESFSLFRLFNQKVNLIIISASPEREKPRLEAFCRKHNIKANGIIMLPNELLPFSFYPSGYSAFKRKWKIEQIIKLNPDYFIDNEELIIRELYRHKMNGIIKTEVMLLYEPELYNIRLNNHPVAILDTKQAKELRAYLTNNLKREKSRQIKNKLLKLIENNLKLIPSQ